VVKTLVVALLLLGSGVARADAPEEPETAQRLSIVGSVVPVAVIGLGAAVELGGSNNAIRDIGGATMIGGALLGVVTPSLGHFYHRDYLDGAMALRAGGVVVELIGLVRAFNSEIGDCEANDPSCHLHASTYALLAGGAAMYLGGMALDIATSHGLHRVQVAPTALRAPSSTVPAVSLGFQF
jgi:hypothetical protein